MSKEDVLRPAVPDKRVTLKGAAARVVPALPSTSILKRPYVALPEDSLFHKSKITCFSVREAANEPVLNQNSTVMPVSKSVLRFDSRVPDPVTVVSQTFAFEPKTSDKDDVPRLEP